MQTDNQPSRTIFICSNGDCADSESARALLERLERLIHEDGLDQFDAPVRVKASLCGCLDVCENGPVMRIFPDRTTYFRLNEAVLERIFREHILGGEVVSELVYEGRH